MCWEVSHRQKLISPKHERPAPGQALQSPSSLQFSGTQWLLCSQEPCGLRFNLLPTSWCLPTSSARSPVRTARLWECPRWWVVTEEKCPCWLTSKVPCVLGCHSSHRMIKLTLTGEKLAWPLKWPTFKPRSERECFVAFTESHRGDNIVLLKKIMKSFFKIALLLSLLHPLPSPKDSDNLSSLSFGLIWMKQVTKPT